MNVKILLLSALCSQLLVACGGGGGSTSPTPSAVGTTPTSTTPTATAPTDSTASLGPGITIDAAFSDLYTSQHNFKTTETDPSTGISYNAKADFLPGPDTTIEGVRAKSASVQRTLRQDSETGPIVRQTSEIQYFLTNPYKLIAVQSLDSPRLYRVASAQQDLPPFPTLSYAGQSAAFYNATDWDSAQKNQIVFTSTNQWATTADSPSTLTFCVNSTTMSPLVTGTAKGSDCYKVQAATAGKPSIVLGVGFVVPKK